MKTKKARSPLARLLQKALIVGLIALIAVTLAMFGPGLLGAWTMPALGLVVVAGLAAMAATR